MSTRRTKSAIPAGGAGQTSDDQNAKLSIQAPRPPDGDRVQPRYLLLHEVGARLGLGQVRRNRPTPPKHPLSENERLARPVRALIKKNMIKRIWDNSSNSYLIREDWLAEYQEQRLRITSPLPRHWKPRPRKKKDEPKSDKKAKGGV